jgi:dienelactone hydrolase
MTGTKPRQVQSSFDSAIEGIASSTYRTFEFRFTPSEARTGPLRLERPLAGNIKLEKIFVPSSESGVNLEVVVAKPRSEGPFPTIIFNHGSTGAGQNKVVYKRTVSPGIIASYFADRGWMTLFPQRRGRGKSGGVYGEGLASDGSGYPCDAEIAMAGFERAVEDMDDVVRNLRTLHDLDQSQLAIGGVSRGGILAIAYSGMRPGTFKGAVNFNGGWLGRACPSHVTVNPQLFERGATSGIPTLWLHGTHDHYYRIEHCRGNFERFLSSGGQGRFVSSTAGHALMFKPSLWTQHLDEYISSLFGT